MPNPDDTDLPRRRFVKGATVALGGLVAAGLTAPETASADYAKPDFQALGTLGALAAVSGDEPKNKTKGNNGVGNGEDPQPHGDPPINDGPGTGPGTPGNQGGANGNGNNGNGKGKKK
jgi:hypothetical protein